VLARISGKWSHWLSCSLMLLGLLLFSGSLASASLWQTPTTFAPAGGTALILAWCWVAVNLFLAKED